MNPRSRLVPISLLAIAGTQLATAQTTFRPPAVPLVAHDPYFSVWSTTNALNGGVTRHWTGAEQPLTSLIRVDGKTFTLMGKATDAAPALPQRDLQVRPTQTLYTFANPEVEVRLTFTSPLLPDDLDLLARPATYVTWNVRSLDGKTHEAKVLFTASGLLTVDRAYGDPDSPGLADRKVNWDSKGKWIGSATQRVLGKSGDDLRIDWGRLYMVAPAGSNDVDRPETVVRRFGMDATLYNRKDLAQNVPAESVALAAMLPLGKVGSESVSQHAILAYDDEYSIQYFGQNLRPYWRRKGMDAAGMLRQAERDYKGLMARCEAFDRDLMRDLLATGGPDYVTIGSLAYRQSFAAQKLVADPKGQPLSFSKENFSNGCIATVDVMYPASPQMMLLSPSLLKATLEPILAYSASSRWKWPFAPHDLGTYPLANGQVYGGGERTEENQMPVEESGNMIIMLAALAKIEGNANYAGRYWPQISKWAQYLADKGFDPESQLSTDDFAGHLAHNVNLSAKAIEALGAYAMLCDMRGLSAEHAKYRKLAQSFADRWVVEAKDGDHYKLAFDRPGTWSQKYNLVWDRLLGLNLFPTSVARTELDFYRTRMNPYGLPLDNRRDYTKLDWTVWTATLTGERKDFDLLVAPIVRWLNDTPVRVPMGDWYRTETAEKEGFQARSVVGGVFIKLLDDPAIWKSWTARDKAKLGGWAPIPKPPIVTPVVPTAEQSAIEWSYTFDKPTGDWFAPSYSVGSWKKGPSGFGTSDTPGTTVRTVWNTPDIWIRREFDLPATLPKDLRLLIHHDEDAEVYVNGILVGQYGGYTAQYQPKAMLDAAKRALKPGRNTIAIHCHQTGGGQYIDAGFATVRYPK